MMQLTIAMNNSFKSLSLYTKRFLYQDEKDSGPRSVISPNMLSIDLENPLVIQQ